MLTKRFIPALLVCLLPVLSGAADVIIADDAPFTPLTVARLRF